MTDNLARTIDRLTREGSVDFHLHSSFSDGSETPQTIVKLMIGAGLRAFALTDHDTTKGIVKAAALLEKLQQEPDCLRSLVSSATSDASTKLSNPDFFPGVELSCEFEGQEVHVLAYF